MRLRLPSRIEAWERLQQAAPDAWVLRHCRAVEALAVAMADRAQTQGLHLDADLVARGALLHDIGRSVTHDIRHAHIGADLLRGDPQPEPLACVVERHTGAGVDEAEATAAGLPPREYTPRSLEERIVAHADNLYSGDKRLDLAAVESKYRAKGLDGAWQRIEMLHQDLCQSLDCDLEALPPAKLADLPGPS
mgnify:CR=1 FL=1